MNNKKKWTKSISVALLVALASLATTGLVLADHYDPAEGVAVTGLTAFNQYQAALDHMEEDRVAAFASAFDSKVNSRVAFEQYQTALDEARWEQAARVFELSTKDNEKSGDYFVPYHSPSYWR